MVCCLSMEFIEAISTLLENSRIKLKNHFYTLTREAFDRDQQKWKDGSYGALADTEAQNQEFVRQVMVCFMYVMYLVIFIYCKNSTVEHLMKKTFPKIDT